MAKRKPKYPGIRSLIKSFEDSGNPKLIKASSKLRGIIYSPHSYKSKIGLEDGYRINAIFIWSLTREGATYWDIIHSIYSALSYKDD